MQKVIIDTNILVSALIQQSFPFSIINELFFEEKFQLCISDDFLHEYFDVLNRKKFSKYPEFVNNAKLLLIQIETRSVKYFPKTPLKIINDIDDNKFLELALECKADFLITGNTNDFTMKKFKRTTILTPRLYWEKYSPK